MAEKIEEDVKKEDASENVSLSEWIEDNWKRGVIDRRPADTYRRTLQAIPTIRLEPLAKPESASGDATALLQIAREEYQRRALQYLARPHRPLDIGSLLENSEEFLYAGIGGRQNITEGMDWCSREIARLAKLASTGGKRKREESDVDGKEDTTVPLERKESLRKLRLELSALSKFYPLAALKKMSMEDAKKLLPPNVVPLLVAKTAGSQ
jgi:hypothetical protein